MSYIGNSLAQGLISGANIQDGTVDTPDLKDGAVTTAKLGVVTQLKSNITNLVFKTGASDTTAVTIDTSQNVGIGASSPGYKLDVQGGTGSFAGSSGVGAIRVAGAGGSWFWIDNPTASTMRFSSGATPGTGLMVLDSNGNVGIGTNSPSAQLHVKNGGGNSISILGQYGSGTIAQVGAFANQMDIKAYNGTNDIMTFTTGASERMRITSTGAVQLASLGVLRLQTGSVTMDCTPTAGGIDGFVWNVSAGYYDWSIGSASKMRLDSSGNFIVGATTNDPSSTTYGIALRSPSVGAQIRMNTDGVIDANAVVIRKQGTDTTRITAAGSMVNLLNSYGGISDAKLKENIVDATPKLEKLNQVRIVNFNLIGNEQNQIGVIAQELEQIFPSMVEEAVDQDIEGNDLGTTTKSVKYSVFVPMLIKAMQEQQVLIDSLTARLTLLENK